MNEKFAILSYLFKCEKLNRTRSSFLGSFRVAHGSIIDDVDSRILQAKSSLGEVTHEIQERSLRWREIEQLTGFSITGSAASSLQSPSTNNSQTVLTRNSSECTLQDVEDPFNSSMHSTITGMRPFSV